MSTILLYTNIVRRDTELVYVWRTDTQGHGNVKARCGAVRCGVSGTRGIRDGEARGKGPSRECSTPYVPVLNITTGTS